MWLLSIQGSHLANKLYDRSFLSRWSDWQSSNAAKQRGVKGARQKEGKIGVVSVHLSCPRAAACGGVFCLSFCVPLLLRFSSPLSGFVYVFGPEMTRKNTVTQTFTFPRGRRGGQVGMCWLTGIKGGRMRNYIYVWMPIGLLLFCVDTQTFQHTVTDTESHSSCFADCSCDSFSMVVYLEVVVGCFLSRFLSFWGM